MPLSDLTPQQQQAFNDRLKELHMDPSKVVPKITPETFKGPIVLSANPQGILDPSAHRDSHEPGRGQEAGRES